MNWSNNSDTILIAIFFHVSRALPLLLFVKRSIRKVKVQVCSTKYANTFHGFGSRPNWHFRVLVKTLTVFFHYRDFPFVMIAPLFMQFVTERIHIWISFCWRFLNPLRHVMKNVRVWLRQEIIMSRIWSIMRDSIFTLITLIWVNLWSYLTRWILLK